MRGVTIETAVDTVIFAHIHNAAILKDFTIEYICKYVALGMSFQLSH